MHTCTRGEILQSFLSLRARSKTRSVIDIIVDYLFMGVGFRDAHFMLHKYASFATGEVGAFGSTLMRLVHIGSRLSLVVSQNVAFVFCYIVQNQVHFQ